MSEDTDNFIPHPICNCELRDRRWNPNTGRCETCGSRIPPLIHRSPFGQRVDNTVEKNHNAS